MNPNQDMRIFANIDRKLKKDTCKYKIDKHVYNSYIHQQDCSWANPVQKHIRNIPAPYQLHSKVPFFVQRKYGAGMEQIQSK